MVCAPPEKKEDEVERNMRGSLPALAIVTGALACLAPSVATAQSTAMFNAGGGRTVVCLGAPAMGAGGAIASCTLGQTVNFQNDYSDGVSQWSRVVLCASNATIAFAPNGHVTSCTIPYAQIFDNIDRATKEDRQVNCAANSQITIDGVGHVACGAGGGGGGAAANTTNGSNGMMLLPAPADPPIAQNGVGGATRTGITRATEFTLSAASMVTQFMTYHYGAQKPPGTISLRSDDGTVYGPWQAAGAVGQGGVPNAYWWVQPNIVLKAGHYVVVDSDPSTWSVEDSTKGAGIFVLWGHAN